jgi:hypothetical protein
LPLITIGQDTLTLEHPFQVVGKKEISADTSVNYLLPIYLLSEKSNEYENSGFWRDYWTVVSNHFSRISNKDTAKQELSNKVRSFDYRKQNTISNQNVSYCNDSVLQILIQKCKDEKIVMLNEDHISSNHRIFAAILLDSLTKYNFRYFGAEGISIYDTLLNNRKFANTNTGYYTRDPMFANLIRKAIKNNYCVFGYEAYGKDRDIKQAENIFNNTFAIDTNAKVFIYAGFGHIHEKEGTTKNNMAREFYLLSGINPLTINQAELFDTINFLSIVDTVNLQNNRMTTDICLANNISYDLYAEKSAYVSYQIKIPEHIANQATIDSLMYVVSIFRLEEYQQDKTAIPIYNYLLDNATTKITVKLPSDDYLYVIKNRFGEVLIESKM